MRSQNRKPLFERLKEGLEEGIAHARGELNLRTVPIPDAPPPMDAKELLALRGALGMSQAVFAAVLNVAPKTIQSWEQGNRVPSLAARRLIQILARDPESVCRIVGVQLSKTDSPIPAIAISNLPTIQKRDLHKTKRKLKPTGLNSQGRARNAQAVSGKKTHTK
jgi:putative transcriptional regulator